MGRRGAWRAATVARSHRAARRRRYYATQDPLRLISEETGATAAEADAWRRLLMGSPEFWTPAQQRAALKQAQDVRRLLDSLEFNDPEYLTLIEPAAVAWWRRHAPPPRKGSASRLPWFGLSWFSLSWFSLGVIAPIVGGVGGLMLILRLLGR